MWGSGPKYFSPSSKSPWGLGIRWVNTRKVLWTVPGAQEILGHCWRLYRGWLKGQKVHEGSETVLAGSREAGAWPTWGELHWFLGGHRFEVLPESGEDSWHLGLNRKHRASTRWVRQCGEVAAHPCWLNVSAEVEKSLASVLPGVWKAWLWGLSMLRTSKGLSLGYQPADSQFPVSTLIRKKRPGIQHPELIGARQIASSYKAWTEGPGWRD